jgi:hypothetical protein
MESQAKTISGHKQFFPQQQSKAYSCGTKQLSPTAKESVSKTDKLGISLPCANVPLQKKPTNKNTATLQTPDFIIHCSLLIYH